MGQVYDCSAHLRDKQTTARKIHVSAFHSVSGWSCPPAPAPLSQSLLRKGDTRGLAISKGRLQTPKSPTQADWSRPGAQGRLDGAR